MQRRLRMPAEWEPQSAVWVTWPDNQETWSVQENRVGAQIEFTALVNSLSQFVPVFVMVNEASLPVAKRNLITPDTVNVQLVDIPTNDAWARDYGPTFVIDQDAESLVAIDWHYNAWGGKYPPFDDDQQVAKRIAAGQKIERIEAGLCFEGGAIETNGAGLVLSTVSCANDANRNSSIAESDRLSQFEKAFESYLGASKTIWLQGDALAGDDTDGHIDQLARFVDERTIVYAWSDHSGDEQRESLAKNLSDLKTGLKSLDGSFRLVPLLVPQSIELHGQRIPASYCNFLITNELVVVPQFGVPEDQVAIETLVGLFPGHHVFGLPSRNLSVGLGSFHCLSQQVPAVVAESL